MRRGSEKVISRVWMSDCLGGQAFFVRHGFVSLMIALSITRSFLATAMSATSFGFPAATSLSRKAFRSGLCLAATMAPRKSVARTLALPYPSAVGRLFKIEGSVMLRS